MDERHIKLNIADDGRVISVGDKKTGNLIDPRQPGRKMTITLSEDKKKVLDISDVKECVSPPESGELRALLIKTFAETVEYGAMCSECCSMGTGVSDDVLCEMSDKPLKPDEYCPQQITVIDNVIPKVLSLLSSRPELEVLSDEVIRETMKVAHREAQLYGDDGQPLPEKAVATAQRDADIATLNKNKGE